MTNASPSPPIDLASLNEDQLRERIAASPYVAVYRALLARQCRGSADDVYRKALHEAALYTPDRVRLYEWLHVPEAAEAAAEKHAQPEVAGVGEGVERTLEAENRSGTPDAGAAEEAAIPARAARKPREETPAPRRPARRKVAEVAPPEDAGSPRAETSGLPAPGLKEVLMQTAAARQVSLEEKHSFLEWLDILESGGAVETAANPPLDALQAPMQEHAAAAQFEAEWQREIDALAEPDQPGSTVPGPGEVESLAERSVAPVAGLATETLAKIMLKQGKIKQALAVYEELLLKYPEKSDYFAALIDDLKAK